MNTDEEPTRQLGPCPSSANEPLRILVVEDVQSAAEMLALFFEMEGMKTRVALDGLEALQAAEEFRPQLICMDLRMPKMDGFEAARRIREKDAEVVMVALCGLDGEDDHQRSLEAGFAAHLVKPVRPDELRNLVKQLLRC